MAATTPAGGKGDPAMWGQALGYGGNAMTGFGNAFSSPRHQMQMPYNPQSMMHQKFLEMQMAKAQREEEREKREESAYQGLFTPQTQQPQDFIGPPAPGQLPGDFVGPPMPAPVQMMGLNPQQTALFQAMGPQKGMPALAGFTLAPAQAAATAKATEEVQQPFRREMANLNADIQRQAQERSQEHATGLQQNQQDFTAKQNDLNREIQNAQMRSTADQKNFDKANTLRDEFNNLTKDFRTVQDAYNKIKLAKDDGPGDMSLLYSYVKLLDPGSVVRESEFATAAASGSFGERIQGMVQRVISGGRLEPGLRQKFIGEADNIYKGQKVGYDTTKTNYDKLAKKYNLNPADIVQEYANPPMQGVGGGTSSVIEYNRDGTRKIMKAK